jgi:hypothetical protein
MSWIAVGVGGAALAGSVFSGLSSARTQGKVANAQLAEQRATRAQALNAAQASPQEIAQMEQANQLNLQDIERKKKLLASADPAIIEAGQQALSLLQGRDAASLNPLKSTQAQQRKQLEDRLRAQLGSGYANTTAGIQALAAFDNAAYTSQANAQQQSLAQLLGVAQNTSANNGLQSNISNSNNLANLYGNQSSRIVSAINGTPITAAGSQYAGQLAGQQQMQGLFQGIGSLATMYAGMQKPTTNNQIVTSQPYSYGTAGQSYVDRSPYA